MGRREWTAYQEIMVGQESKGGSEPLCPAPIRPSPQHITHQIREGSRSPMAGGWYVRPTSPDQPLDLSAKPPKPPTSPNKTIFKAKPRLPGVSGRKSYTEEELQNALRDIQSGKLGTRRAAVIYGIPRSTLRNKVYKISQETSREYEEDEEEETSGAEEERETEQLLNRPLTVHDILRLSSEVRSWPCLQQLLAGASTSSEDQSVGGFGPMPRNGETNTTPPPVQPQVINKDQPLDFRRSLNNNTTNTNNNHVEDRKPSSSNKQQQGGKGTRPKRGKYRNYDRDSLVEAVRAVQRGEMSVHRAGSYYGVPHSTLEYKVKERHLMRPRKREPKPQPPPVDDKRKEEEKRPPVAPRTPQLTPPLANGLKLAPLFDPAALHQFRPSFPYWQAPFPLFGRPELFQQDLAARRLAAPSTVPPEDGPPTIPLSKTAREMAESLLETTEGTSGSFLDGIIRSSLDTGLPSRESGGKVLLEQLCRGTQIEKTSSSPPVIQSAPAQPATAQSATTQPSSPGSSPPPSSPQSPINQTSDTTSDNC